MDIELNVKDKRDQFEVLLNGTVPIKSVDPRKEAVGVETIETNTCVVQKTNSFELCDGTETPPPPSPPSPSTFPAVPGGLEVFCTEIELEGLPIPEPEYDNGEGPDLVDQGYKEQASAILMELSQSLETIENEAEDLAKPSSESEEDLAKPSTVFQSGGHGQQRVSPWGPPTRSVNKKKGWEEPAPPAPKVHTPQQRIILENELLNVFDRRGKGMSIVGNTTMGDNVGGLDGNSGKHKKDNDIGGDVHVRVSYTTPDTLHITVKRAEQLCAKTKSCSPYAMCTLLGEYKVQTTEVMNNTTAPIWEKTFDFDVPLQQLQTTAVLIVVYNKHGVREDEFIGETHISLNSFKHFHVIDNWFPLEDLRGEEDKFNGYSEFQKVHSSIKTRCLSDTLKQDELRKEENWSSY